MAMLSTERVERLRDEDPEVFEAYIELADISAQAWNALIRFADMPSRFRGKLYRLGKTLDARHKQEHPDLLLNGHSAMDSTVEAMQRDGWDRDQGC